MSRTDPALLKSLPKVLLHEHLDGGLRPATLIELLRARGLPPPAPTPGALVEWFAARAHAGSLEEFLKGFALTVAAMATPAALERVAREAVQDAAADGIVLAEFRIAPLLFEPYGVAPEAAVEALLAGLADPPIPCGLIVCAMRHLPAAQTERAARLAIRYRGWGVVGFDLAGAEAGHPPSDHASALALCRDAGLPLTLHAGEADGATRVIEAGRLGARRIGHGVRLADAIGTPGGAALIDEAKALGLHLEICPTSNVQTGAAASLATHPIRALWNAGVSLSFHTDNRLISGITHSSEAQLLVDEAGFSLADLQAMARAAARASFLPEPAKAAVLARLGAQA
jgi:adenosine deaminase